MFESLSLILTTIGDYVEAALRSVIVAITNYLPVKVIRDEKGVPFLYRYHLFTLGNDGPGLCIHRFVKSDPERGYHDHPWNRAVSFILCGGYDERILNEVDNEVEPDKIGAAEVSYKTYRRNRWTFNYLNGVDTFHRVMIEEGKDAWTLFAFQKRSKIWGMVSLDGKYHPMSKTVEDNDGGWWYTVGKGLGLHSHLPNTGKVIATVDIIVLAPTSSSTSSSTNSSTNSSTSGPNKKEEQKILLIKRGKDPYKGAWAFPGGRVDEKDKDLLTAAYRELREETHLSENDIKLEYLRSVGNNTRDPRGFCVTNVFMGKLPGIVKVRAGDDAVDYQWFDLSNLPEMAFDHKQILTDYLHAQND